MSLGSGSLLLDLRSLQYLTEQKEQGLRSCNLSQASVLPTRFDDRSRFYPQRMARLSWRVSRGGIGRCEACWSAADGEQANAQHHGRSNRCIGKKRPFMASDVCDPGRLHSSYSE